MLETKETLCEKYVLVGSQAEKEKKKILWFILVVYSSFIFEFHLHCAIFILSQNCILTKICEVPMICKEGNITTHEAVTTGSTVVFSLHSF